MCAKALSQLVAITSSLLLTPSTQSLVPLALQIQQFNLIRERSSSDENVSH